MTDKPKRGGARPGAGRPKAPLTVKIQVRVRHNEELPVRAAIKETVKKLRNEQRNQIQGMEP
jgi:hypothetical protein